MTGPNNNSWDTSATTFDNPDQWNDGAATNGAEFNDSGANGFGQDNDGAPVFNGNSGGCFNCGEEGHMKADCPNPAKPREFTGNCNLCGEVGHQARACPTKPKVCKQCHAENDHDTIDCKNKKVIDRTRVEEKSVKEAWAMLKAASDDKDTGDFREAVEVLVKALDGLLSYKQLETECRKRNFSVYLIALEQEIKPAFTNVDLEGNVDKTYTVGYYTSPSCHRPVLKSAWPADEADNLARLEDAGVPMERGIPICGNCNTAGHVRKDCPEEKNVFEGPKVLCVLCDQPGHRVRDCTEERQKDRAPRTCKFCDSPDHIAKDCDQKPAQVCHNCYQEGHNKSDCTNERVFKCNNCDEIGHQSKECKAPKDWSRVKCRHCGEFGHGSENRCDPEKKAAFAAAKATGEGNDTFGGNAGDTFAGNAGDAFDTNGGGFENSGDNFTAGGTNDWESAGNTSAQPAATWEAAPTAGGSW